MKLYNKNVFNTNTITDYENTNRQKLT